MKIFVIRHGEVKSTYDEQGRRLVYRPDDSMAKLGEIQIYKLGKALEDEGVVFDALYSSPYRRAQESAQILHGKFTFPIYIINDLRDAFPNSGEGKPFEDVAKVGGDIYAHPLGEHQETLDHLVERAGSTIKFVLTDSKSRGYNSVGIVSHGDLICALNWSLKHPDSPSSYDEMEKSFYLQKGEVCEYTFNERLELEGESRIISVDEVRQSIEGFRNPEKE